MECPEKELKQLSLHVRGGALQRHTETLKPSPLAAQELLTAQAQSNKEVSQMPGNSKLSASHPHLSYQQVRSRVLGRNGLPETECLGCAKGLFSDGNTQVFKLRKGY